MLDNTPEVGIKNDNGKVRFELVPPYSHKQIAKVFTHGFNKYNKEDDGPLENNWHKGLKWSRLMGALERHYQAFKDGVDIDSESGLFHLAHCGANIMMLLDYYKSHPELDDRRKPYLHTPKIVLDVDDVVADFASAFKEKFGLESFNYWDSSYSIMDNLNKMIDSGEAEDFYVNLKVKHRPDFVPHAYLSSRSVPVEWTKKFLENNGLPCRPVHHVPFNESKVETFKSIGGEVMIDDRFENFVEMQRAGITAFLMDAEHNQHYKVGYKRIYDLQLSNFFRY